MSSSLKRTLNDSTNENKRLKNDSAIDLNFDLGEEGKKSKSQSSSSSISTSSDSLFDDDDDVFEDERNRTGSFSKTSQNQGRKRLNGTSKEPINKRKKENINMDQTLNQLREEQARIDAHSLSVLAKGI